MGVHARSADVGELLVSEGLISLQQLERARRVRRRLDKPRWLGDVLVELGYVYRVDIERALQRSGASLPLGEFLVARGHLESEELDALRAEHGDVSEESLQELLVSQGVLSERQLLQALSERLGVPYLEASPGIIDAELVRRVPLAYLEANLALPVAEGPNDVSVAVAEPADRRVVDELQRVFDKPVSLALASAAWIRETLAAFRANRIADRSAVCVDETGARVENGEQVPPLTLHLIQAAVEARASDIHVEPHEDRLRIRFRVDGVLTLHTDLPLSMHGRLISQIKVLAQCNIAERRRHQDGRFHLRLHDGRIVDLRVSTYVTIRGESVVIRILEREAGCLTLDELGFSPDALALYRDRVLSATTGVVIISGPTGSGKTTTLYSSIQHCNRSGVKIITVEDPVEFAIPGVSQCQVNVACGRSFENTLRAMVRQDPDIIVLGEIRDRISAEISVQAALTGHKVFSTFHTEDSVGGLLRLLHMNIDAFLISSTVVSIIGQRLVRKLCFECRDSFQPTRRQLAALRIERDYFGGRPLYRGRGCPSCHHTGYRGRIGIYEVLVLDEGLRDLILAKAPAHEIRRHILVRSGQATMLEDGLAKVAAGLTSLDEVARTAPICSAPRPLDRLQGL
ncbi:MAG: type II/IV secretion system protein [Planctomycetota bacterium]|nr:MAG: type II/IV secretion system protein [Planctomycetota bacterium]